MGTSSKSVPVTWAEPSAVLTARSLLLGAFVGAGLGVANLIVSLKTGLSVGVALTAVTAAAALRRFWSTPFTLAEGTTTQSVASAAGFSTGSTLASATTAYVLVNGQVPSTAIVVAWTLLLSLFGCLLAWPLRTALLERDALPFPSGAAAAVALESLWQRTREAVGQVRALLASAAGAAIFGLARDAGRWVPSSLMLPGAAGRYGFGLELSLLALGGGALLGPRLGLSLGLGAVLTFGLLGPWAADAGWVASSDLGGVMGFSLWPGTALFSGAALLHFTLQLRHVRFGATLSQLGRSSTLWAVSTAVVCGLLLWVGTQGLALPAVAVAIALALAFPLCLISCRVTGETDVTPAGPLGQFTQLSVGAALPAQLSANVTSAAITAGAAASAADLMSDWKTGAILKVEPARQFAAQLVGCLVGAAVVAPLFVQLVPSAEALDARGFAAPAARMFVSTGRLFLEGTAALPRGAVGLSLGMLLIGMLLAALEAKAPRLRRWVPSPIALGLAMLLPPSLSLMFAVGGVASALWSRSRSAALLAPVAAGLIAGDSLAGAAVVLHGAFAD